LAARFYGDAELDWLIAGASGIGDPDVIDVGQRLIIPDITRHTVLAGDTLSGLAVRFYGDASLYPLIATVNGIADPAVIDVGPPTPVLSPASSRSLPRAAPTSCRRRLGDRQPRIRGEGSSETYLTVTSPDQVPDGGRANGREPRRSHACD
jgi:LysM repeat protein